MRLEKITIEEAQKMLGMAEIEGAFVKSNKDKEMTVLEIVSLFKDDPQFAIYNLMKGRKRIGLITAFPNKEPGVIGLGVMYMKPKYRGKGFGKIMVGLFINKSRELGYKRIFTKTWSSNIASQKVFSELNFDLQETEYEDRVNGDATISYMLRL